jgi:hypothetical protein
MSALKVLRAATAASFVLALGSVIATSCATPEFDFGDGHSTSLGGTGGQASHCDNRRDDADESDVDCGGIDCDPCALGRRCEVAGDCVNGACTDSRCQNPTCTDRVKNGAETDVDCGGEPAGCPACGTGRVCEQDDNCASQVCLDGECQEATCKDHRKNQDEIDVDCAGTCSPCDVGRACFEDGDCRDAPTDAEHPASAVCNDGTCELECKGTQLDCNEKAADGCETNVGTSLAHCGACDAACAPDHAEGSCAGGKCSVESCKDGYADVNGKASDGCEVHYLTDPKHCGTTPDALVACSSAHGTPACNDGVCSIACDDDFDDCNDNVSDGCEANLRSDVNHCTSCDKKCSPQGSSAASCDPDDSDEDGSVCGLTACPVAMGTDTSCTTCGVACGSATPYCHGEDEGCQAHMAIGVAQRKQISFNQQTELTGVSSAFDVTGTPAGNRLLVVGVSRRSNTLTTMTVKYGNTNLTNPATVTGTGPSSSAIYVLGECELAAAGNQPLTVTVAHAGDNFGAVVADAVLFRNVAQSLGTAVTKSGATASPNFPSVVLSEHSWFYGIATQSEGASWTGSTPTGALTVTPLSLGGQHKPAASVWGPLASGGIFGWTLSGTANWTDAGLPLAPATATTTCP